ncbi:MAG: CDP-diacylglycerol--serine O-phosphatidyltransferase [Gammaproteobacteria bacterium]|jgi:CDP-diacylglycerol---serine O-phosphatidyltransferase|nr:CDP-diacylglycerol--serine O-phosphatidyltransferase [Gammaproteobacteria bacterium]
MNTRRRGIYLLPNLFTTSALFGGFYAIIAAINGRYEAAAIAMFVAMVLDGMDGRIARMTNTQSDFGVQYDSLSDLVSFGLAPSLVMYQWSLYGLGKLGWLAAFIYAAATALRLARFNTQAAVDDKQFFQGLPSPAAAALIAGFIWLGDANDLYDGTNLLWITFPLTITTGLLMVSNVRYHSFKQFDLKGRVPFIYILMIVLVLVLIALRPSIVLFVLAFTYALSGPVMTLLLIRRHRAKRRLHEES